MATLCRWVGVALLIGSVTAGCGGANRSNAGAEIPSSPYPAGENAAATPLRRDPPRASDPKQICAGAAALDASPHARSRSAEAVEAWASLDGNDKAFLRGTHARSAPTHAKTQSMADLRALEKRGSWAELLEHASDIQPSQRGPTWDALVERAAIGYMQTFLTSTASFQGVFASQELLIRYPQLLKSEAFMAKRGEAGKAASESCLESAYGGQHCIDMMRDFLKTSNTSPDVGFEFGKIVRRTQNHYVAVPFFGWALERSKPDKSAMCADEDLRLATVAGLGLPPDEENAVGARQIAANACWNELKSALQQALLEHQTGYFRDNTCAVLKAKGEL